MKLPHITLLFVLLCCCHSKQEPNESVYLIEHSQQDTASVSHYEKARLVTWLKDTLPFGCGSELMVTSQDSTSNPNYTFQVTGARLILSGDDPRRFILEPHSKHVHVKVHKAETTVLEKDFVSPQLPYPSINIRKDSASYQIVFSQPNARLKRIYPKDCRYSFKKVAVMTADSTVLFETMQPSFQIQDRYKKEKLLVKIDSMYRLNYRDQVYSLSPSSMTIELNGK